MMSDLDKLYESRGGTAASDGQLSRIRQLMAEESDTRAEIDTAEAMLETAKDRNKEIRHRLLPEAMLDAGVREFVTDDGVKAKVAFITDGSLGPARNAEELAAREAKLDCIIEHGGGEIVKQIVAIEFPKEFLDQAEVIQERLTKLFQTKKWGAIPVQISRERTVNHQTLGSWIRERMASSEAEEHLPPSFFERVGIWYGEAAKIVRPRAKKDA
jgi:hypothetical protein